MLGVRRSTAHAVHRSTRNRAAAGAALRHRGRARGCNAVGATSRVAQGVATGNHGALARGPVGTGNARRRRAATRKNAPLGGGARLRAAREWPAVRSGLRIRDALRARASGVYAPFGCGVRRDGSDVILRSAVGCGIGALAALLSLVRVGPLAERATRPASEDRSDQDTQQEAAHDPSGANGSSLESRARGALRVPSKCR